MKAAWFFHLFLRRQPTQGSILAGSDNLVLKEGRSYQLKIQLLHLNEFGYFECFTINFWTLSVHGSHKRRRGLFLLVLDALHEASTRPLSPLSLTYSEIRKL